MKVFLIILCLQQLVVAAETLILPSQKTSLEQTVVWSPGIKAMWDDYTAAGGVKKLDLPNLYLNRLEAMQFDADSVLPVKGVKLLSGEATPEFIEDIKTSFGEDDAPSLTPVPGGIVSIFSLEKHLNLESKLFRSKGAPMAFKATTEAKDVKFFGIKGKNSGKYSESVSIYEYEEDGNMLVGLDATEEDESIILYRPKNALSLDVALLVVRSKLKKRISGLSPYDDLRIPYVDIQTKADLTSFFEGVSVGEEPPRRIIHMGQKVSFELSHTGAQLKVAARVLDSNAPFGAPPVAKKPEYRKWKLIFDRPFYVFLWRKNAELPYFSAWIGDSKYLQPF